MLFVPLGIFLGSCFFCIACSFIIIVDDQGNTQLKSFDNENLLKGHMHMRGCYDWFRPPRTKYEIWREQHERNRMKRLLEDAEQEIWRVSSVIFALESMFIIWMKIMTFLYAIELKNLTSLHPKLWKSKLIIFRQFDFFCKSGL